MRLGKLAGSLLEHPVFYNFYQDAIGEPNLHRRFIEEFVKPPPRSRVLDVGCGTGNARAFLPAATDYTGIDINAGYTAHAKRRFPGQGTFLSADLTSCEYDIQGSFDIAFSNGVLHHLSDGQARTLVAKVYRALRPNGRFVTIDPCFHEGQHLISRFLVSNDRGECVREKHSYAQLLDKFETVSSTLVTDMLRVPFSQVVVVGLKG